MVVDNSKHHRSRITELDGIRAIAISMVLAFHCLRFPTTSDATLKYLARIPSGGWGGVDIFFVLSGFLVGGILINGRGHPNLLSSFFIRRAVRILPLYFVVLATFYITKLILPKSLWLYVGAAPWWSYVTLTQNFATPLLGSDAFYLGPTWSLAVEAQIYLVLGFLLTRMPEKRVVPVMLTGVVLAELCRLAFVASGHGIFGYFVLPARFDGACFGVITAIAVRSEYALGLVRIWSGRMWLTILGLFAVAGALSMVGQGVGSVGAGIYTHLGLAVASSLTIAVLMASPQGLVNQVLRSKPLVWLGSVSYGVYLVHIPVIGIAHAAMGQISIVIDSWSAGIATIIGLSLTFGLAWLSWKYFEKPLNDRAHRLTKGAGSTNLPIDRRHLAATVPDIGS